MMKNLFPCLLFLLFISACGTEEGQENSDPDKKVITETEQSRDDLEAFDALILGDGVRLRSDSTLEAEITGKLQTGDLVTIEKQSEAMMIMKGSDDFKADLEGYHWYKVKAADGQSGWVYGQFLYFLPDGESSDAAAGTEVKTDGRKLIFSITTEMAGVSMPGFNALFQYRMPFLYDPETKEVFPFRCSEKQADMDEFSCQGDNHWMLLNSGRDIGSGRFSKVGMNESGQLEVEIEYTGYTQEMDEKEYRIVLKATPAGEPFSYWQVNEAESH